MNKKIIFVGLAFVLFAGTTQASFFDWFNVNKVNNDSQQAAAIANAIIKVVSPNGGEVWKAGTKKNISFKGNSRAIINISLEWSGGALPIGESVTLNKSKTSAYSWTIPTTLEERSDYKVRIDYKGGQGSDSSDKTFTIKSTPSSSSSKSSSSRSSKSSSSKSSKSSANAATKVSLKVQKQGNGVITSDDGKINCGKDCSEVYYSGGAIYLYATSAKGFAFDKWTGNACGDSVGIGISTSTEVTIGQCQVNLNYNKNKTITAVAHFKKTPGSSSSKSSSSRSSRSSTSSSKSKSSKSSATITKIYLLKIIKSGKGSVTDEQRQIVCGTDCRGDSGTYVAGSEAKLTAVPDGGYVFEKFVPKKECSSIYTSGFGFNDNQWIKQAFAYREGENVVCVTTMNKNKTITAIFKKISTRSSSSSKSSSSRSSKSSSSKSSRSSATTTPGNA